MKELSALFTFLAFILAGFLSYEGFTIIEDGSRGIKKSGTQYVMEEMKPGYHLTLPVYTSVYVKTIRPILVNYSASEAHKPDTELLMYEPVLEGKDNKGIPIKLALSIEVKPVAEQLAEMYKMDGDFENAFYKKVLQQNREAVQSTLSRFDVDKIMSQRVEVESELAKKLSDSYSNNPYFRLENLNLKNIIVPPEVKKKQIEVQQAKQEAEKSKALIVKVQNEAKSAAAKAQGEADKVRIKAEGEAQAILVRAEARAKANKLLAESLTPAVLQSQRISKWNGILPRVTGIDSNLLMEVK